VHFLRLLDDGNVEIDYDRLLAAAYQHARQRLVVVGVDFLMRHIRGHVNEVARPGFSHEFQRVAPAHACSAAHHVDHALHRAVVMRSGFCFGMDHDGPRPELFGARARMRDRRRTVHSGRLRRVDVELVAVDDAYAVVLPFGFVCFCHGSTSAL
jgi:hypothetical protein